MPAFTHLTNWLSRPTSQPARKMTLRVESLEARDVPALIPVGSTLVGDSPLAVALADFNGDALPDLVSVNDGLLGLFAGTVSILSGSGTGSFGAGPNLGVGVGPAAIAVGDVNADGKLDLAVTNSGGNSVSLFLNNGTGSGISFLAGQTLAVGNSPRGAVMGDFDGDGKLDLAVANRTGNTVSLLRGNGNGTFQSAVSVAAVGNPNQLVVADFDADGRLDLAYTAPATNTVNILRNASSPGSFSFAAAQTFAVGNGSFGLAVGDFNGDAKTDLAVTNNGSISLLGIGLGSTVSVLLNNSTGSGNVNFGTQVAYATGVGPTNVAAADFTADGKIDLVVTNRTSNTVSLLAGNGDGTFQAKTDSAVGLGPLGLAVGDLDGNTVPDIVTGLLGDPLDLLNVGNTVTALLSDATVPPPSVPFNDSFNRGDAGTLGSNWVMQTGTASIDTNSALATSPLAVATVSNVSQQDSASQASVGLLSVGTSSAALVARYGGATATATMYYAGLFLENGVVTARIYRQVGGTATELARSASITPSGSNTIRFETIANSLKLFVNGTLETFAYDSAITGTGLTGLRLTNGVRADDFTDADVALLPVALPPVPGQSATDAFTQASGTQLSRFWQDQYGNLSVTGNTAVGQTGLNLSTYNIPPTANAGAQANAVFTANSQTVGLVTRYSGTATAPLSSFYWGALTNVGNGQLYAAIYKFGANGATTQLASVGLTGTGGLLRFEANSGSLKLFLDGNLILSGFDGAPLSSGVVGLLSTQGGSADDFVAFALGTTTSLPFTDSLNPGNFGNQLSSDWTQRAGSFDLASGTAAATGAGGNVATLNGVNMADVVVTGTFKTPSNLEVATGLVARYSGLGEQNFYWAALNPFGHGVPGYSAQIWKVVNGQAAVLNANAYPLSASSNPSTTNAVLRFEVVGSSLKLFINNQLASYAIDTSLTSGSVGIRSVAGSRIDEFNASPLTVATPNLPFADTFVDNAPRNTLSVSWQEQSGYFYVAGGTAVGKESTQGNTATLNGVNAADVSVTATFKTAAGTVAATGLVARYGGPGENNFYWAALNPFGGGVPGYSAQIWKVVNGQATLLNANTHPLSATSSPSTTNAVMRFEVVGSSLKLFINGLLASYATDSSLVSGSVGIRTGMGGGLAAFSATLL